MIFFLVKNKKTGKFWSDEKGWVDDEHYDVFLPDEMKDEELPKDGEKVLLEWLA